jgi:hypothetical protein
MFVQKYVQLASLYGVFHALASPSATRAGVAALDLKIEWIMALRTTSAHKRQGRQRNMYIRPSIRAQVGVLKQFIIQGEEYTCEINTMCESCLPS